MNEIILTGLDEKGMASLGVNLSELDRSLIKKFDLELIENIDGSYILNKSKIKDILNNNPIFFYGKINSYEELLIILNNGIDCFHKLFNTKEESTSALGLLFSYPLESVLRFSQECTLKKQREDRIILRFASGQPALISYQDCLKKDKELISYWNQLITNYA
jgi:hypothetical protein